MSNSSNPGAVLIFAQKDVLARIEAWQDHLSDERRLADKTLTAYERDLEQFLRFLTNHLGGSPSISDLETLRPADFRSFLATRRKAGVQSRSLARGLAGIRSFLKFLEKQGEINAAASDAIRPPNSGKSLPKPVSPKDAKTIVGGDLVMEQAAWIQARNTAVLTLLYGCGLRLAEALSLTGK
ncbi:recombinase XerC, partial [Roseibium hamelinense]